MFGLPWLLMAILIVGLCVTTGVVGLSINRRFVLPRLGKIVHQNEVTAILVHGVLIIYGLAVALLAIAVWENHAEVRRTIWAEPAAIGSIYRDTGGYPEPVRGRLRTLLRSYTEYVIHEAWPMQRRGKIAAGGVEFMDRFQEELFAFDPATEGQKARYQETLHAYNELVNGRRLRLDSVTSGLPGPMWAVILLGALIALGATFFFDVTNVRLHRVMIALLSSITGLLIFLIAYYDRPYRGRHGVSPEAYELIHEQLMKP